MLCDEFNTCIQFISDITGDCQGKMEVDNSTSRYDDDSNTSEINSASVTTQDNNNNNKNNTNNNVKVKGDIYYRVFYMFL
jgi:hypothetical protein